MKWFLDSKFCNPSGDMMSILPPERLGNRRIKQDVVEIRAHEDMQREIDALDGNEEVTILRFSNDGLCSDEYDRPDLAINLPNLREVHFVDVDMGQIHLTKELTPKVESISMENPAEDDDDGAVALVH